MGSDEIKFSPIIPRTRKLNNGKNWPLMGFSTDRLFYQMEEYIEYMKKKKQETKNEEDKQKIDQDILKIKEDAEKIIY